MSSEKTNSKRPLTWELTISTLGFGLCAIYLAQKHELFQALARPLTEAPNSGALLWMSAATIMLTLSFKVRRRSRYGRSLRVLSLTCCCGLLMSMLIFNNSWIRYRVLKTETLSTPLGFSQSKAGLRTELNRELLQARASAYITDDLELLKHLAFENGTQFRAHPAQALVVYSSLKRMDVSFQETWESAQGKNFLLTVLVGEANPEPWYGLEWLKKPELSPLLDVGLHAGLLTGLEAEQVLQYHLSSPPENVESLESVLYAVMNFPSFAEESQRVDFFGIWAEALKERSKFLAQGLEVRELVRASLKTTTPVSLRVEIVDELDHKTWQDKEVPTFAPYTLRSFVRSCGIEAQLVENQEADITIKATLADIDMYEYRAPVYGMKTTYETKYRRAGKTSVSYQAAKNESVVTGSRTETARGVGLSFELSHKGETITVSPTLFYWWDAIFKEQDREKNKSVHTDNTFGRTWPYGVHEKSYKYRFLQLDSVVIAESY